MRRRRERVEKRDCFEKKIIFWRYLKKNKSVLLCVCGSIVVRIGVRDFPIENYDKDVKTIRRKNEKKSRRRKKNKI